MEANKKLLFSMTDLGDEYLYMIFKKLDATGDRNSLGLTCQRFFEIENSSRRCLELGTISLSNNSSCTMNIDSRKLDKLLTRFTQLESLSLSRCINVSDSGLSRLENCGSKLNTLYLDYLDKITSKGLFSIANGCPILSVISLSGCAINDKGLILLAESCKVLKEVDLGGCCKITDSGVGSLIQNCRQLRTLNISSCRKIRGASFQGVSPTLACFKADLCVFTEGVNGILSGGGLEYLSLGLNPFIKPIVGNELITFGLLCPANLKILDFSLCQFVTDAIIISIAKGCPLLQEWDLSECNSSGHFGFERIGWSCKNLEKLILNGCWHFSDDDLLGLGNGCKRLSVLYIKSCHLISSEGKQAFKTLRQDVTLIESEGRLTVPNWVFTR